MTFIDSDMVALLRQFADSVEAGYAEPLRFSIEPQEQMQIGENSWLITYQFVVDTPIIIEKGGGDETD